MTDLTPKQIWALGLFWNNTLGTADVWRLAGPINSETRRNVLGGLLGRKVAAKDSGVTALRTALFDLFHPTGNCLASQERDLADRIAAALGVTVLR